MTEELGLPELRRYKEIQNKILKAKPSHPSDFSVTLIAVSKKQSVDAIEALYRLGQRDFGENYVQELIEKAEELERRGCVGVRWHFIGHLQMNKVNALIPYVSFVHALDSEKLARRLAQKWAQFKRVGKLPVFIEVNLDQEATKAGLSPERVVEFVRQVSEMPELQLLGLMCIPSPEGDPRLKFKALRELEVQCRPFTQGLLSMGMSADFDIAIQEGATHIRVGTALFGDRSHLN
jgi:pyridoxal phosphate enzyme (YggS family)